MSLRVPTLNKLVQELSKQPGIGHKTAERMAYNLLLSSQEDLSQLGEILISLKDIIKKCNTCYAFTENEDGDCDFCTDKTRQDDMLCVVESPQDISRIESSGVFKGRYHVLHGCIDPLAGIHPYDLTTESLVRKVKKSHEDPTLDNIGELIFALDADIEGDTTVLYLTEQLKEVPVVLSRIAYGVPLGGNIDFVDSRTLGKALENRNKV